METSRETDSVQSAEGKPVAVVAATDCRKRGRVRSFIFSVITFGPLKYVFKILQKMMAVVGSSLAVEDVGSMDHPTTSPSTRRVVTVKKRLGRLARCLLSFAPQKLQTVLGYPMSKGLGEGGAPEEVRQSPNKPFGKGSKRKVEDVDMEEQQSWIEALTDELPEDDEEDVTYQCSKSETDSEEYRSKNDTESDLEFEEKDGHIMLKDSVPEDAQSEPVVNSDSLATKIKEDLANNGAQKMESGGEEHMANGDQSEPVLNSDCSEAPEVKEDEDKGLVNDGAQTLEGGGEEHLANGDQEK